MTSGLLDMLDRAGIHGTVAVPAESRNWGMILPTSTWDIRITEEWAVGRFQAETLAALRLGTLVHGANQGSRTYQVKLKAKRPAKAAAELGFWRTVGAYCDPLPWIRRVGQGIRPPWKFPEECTHLILPTMIHEDVTQHGIIRAAREAGKPIWAVPASWDTLTTKGAFLDPPDRLAVWGHRSFVHATEDHGFHQSQVTVVGPPQFWPYAVTGLPKMALEPYVLFAGTTVNYAPDEIRILHALSDAMDREGADEILVYRPHPRAKEPVLPQHHHRILLDPRWRPGWSLDRGDIPYMRTLVGSATCVITAFSTVSIEAALCGIPTIFIGFGDSAHGAGQALDHANFEHMADVVGRPGAFMARSIDDTVDLIEKVRVIPRPWPEPHAWSRLIAHVDQDPRKNIIDWLKEA